MMSPVTPGKAQYEQGPVSVDGAWFAAVEGEWRQVPSPTFEARTRPTIPDRNHSIDGAHKLSEQQHS
jgi:hypothetical protein